MTEVKKEGILLSGNYPEFGKTDVVVPNPDSLISPAHIIIILFLI